ncbi:MAG: cobalt ECF transporter T component CbiQ [Rhodocyclaceae bacterium]|jgi:cobalt/nickel transport system permease protein|nr:cobalt ECF transporter T component CbiQ [Rhodocyclaceae bacterium]
MGSIEGLLREVRSLDATADQASWLSRIDPRATILATMAFILTVVSFDRHAVAALLPLAFFPVVLARLGDIGLARIGRKVLLALPFALMVGLFNPLFDTTPHLELLGQPISGGWLSLTSILIRTVLTVAATLILVACLGMHRLCAALDRLGVPRVLTTQLLFMHRYIVVLGGELGRMNLARELRSQGTSTLPLAVYGSMLGHLLLRTLERAQRIHQAMLSRGYDGQMPQVGLPLSWHWRDTAFLAACLVVLAWLRATDPTALLGRWLMGIAT